MQVNGRCMISDMLPLIFSSMSVMMFIKNILFCSVLKHFVIVELSLLMAFIKLSIPDVLHLPDCF